MKTLFLILSALIVLINPTQALAALEAQPPGQVPIVEPLQPPQSGVNPNYSGSVQHVDTSKPSVPDSNQPTDAENGTITVPDAEGSQTNSITSSIASESQPAKSKLWVILAVIGVLVLAGIIWAWVKKSGNSTNAFVIALLLIPAIVFSGKLAQAQSLPVNSQPIQRTIEVEGADAESGKPAPTKKPASAALYGLLAIGLVIVASGATYFLWVKHPIERTSKN